MSFVKGDVYPLVSVHGSVVPDWLLHKTLIVYSSSLGCIPWEVFADVFACSTSLAYSSSFLEFGSGWSFLFSFFN